MLLLNNTLWGRKGKEVGYNVIEFSDYDFTGESEKNILNANFYKVDDLLKIVTEQ